MRRALVAAGAACVWLVAGCGPDAPPPVVTDAASVEPTLTPPQATPTTVEAPPSNPNDTAPAVGVPGPADPFVRYRSCAEAEDAGAAPLRRGEPGYRRALDRDRDGWACEGTP